MQNGGESALALGVTMDQALPETPHDPPLVLMECRPVCISPACRCNCGLMHRKQRAYAHVSGFISMKSERKKSFAELCYYVAALTQSTGVQRFDVDLGAREAIERAFPLSTLLGKLRFGKNAKFKLSADSTVEGGTALMAAFYDAIKDDCFGSRAVLWQGRFEPRLEAFWDGLKTHPVLLHMQPPMVLYNPCGPAPRQDSNPAIVTGLNDFVTQLESRFATRKLKASIADHQAMYRRRVERVRSRLEVLMTNFPATSWVSFSVWYAVLPGAGHASRQGSKLEGCSAVNKAIAACLGRREAVRLLRPVFQRDEWVCDGYDVTCSALP